MATYPPAGIVEGARAQRGVAPLPRLPVRPPQAPVGVGGRGVHARVVGGQPVDAADEAGEPLDVRQRVAGVLQQPVGRLPTALGGAAGARARAQRAVLDDDRDPGAAGAGCRGGGSRGDEAAQPAGRRGHQDRDGRAEPGHGTRSARDPHGDVAVLRAGPDRVGADAAVPSEAAGVTWVIGLATGPRTRSPRPPPRPQTRSPGRTPVSRIVNGSPRATVRRSGDAVKSPAARGAQRSTGRAWADARRHWSLVFLVMPLSSPSSSGRRRRRRSAPTCFAELAGARVRASTWSARTAAAAARPRRRRPVSPSAQPARPVLLVLVAP